MALNPLVSLIGRILARSGRKRGNRHADGRNDKTTTVTLAAHARRGLMKVPVRYRPNAASGRQSLRRSHGLLRVRYRDRNTPV